MEKQDYKAIRAALFMSYAKPTAIRLLDLIDKPVQATKEQPNLEIEPEHFESLNKILGTYTEMMSDDSDGKEEHEDELALCEVLQDRMDFLG